MSIWQAKTGLVVAQMKALEILDKTVVDEAKAKARAKRERMPPGAKDKQLKRFERRHQQELEQIKVLKTDEEKAAFVQANARLTGTARIPQILKWAKGEKWIAEHFFPPANTSLQNIARKENLRALTLLHLFSM